MILGESGRALPSITQKRPGFVHLLANHGDVGDLRQTMRMLTCSQYAIGDRDRVTGTNAECDTF
jgi:hypothetical protein